MAGNLEFITSASGTSVSSLSVTDCFSDKYDVYQISSVDGQLTTGAANYDYASLEIRASASFIERQGTGDTDFRYVVKGYSNPQEGNFVMYIYNPTDTGSYTFSNWQSAGWSGATNLNGNYKGIGVLKDTQEVTGLKLIGDASANLDKAKISVYGLASN